MRARALCFGAIALAGCASAAGNLPPQDLAGFLAQDFASTFDHAVSPLDLATGDSATSLLYPPPTSLAVHSTGGGDLYAIWNSPTNKLYVVGAGGTILTSTGAGVWTPQTSGTTQDLDGVWGSSDTDVYAVGEAGVILHSAGDGTWTPQAFPSGVGAVQLDQVWGLDATHVYAVGANGTVLFNDGAGWQSQPTTTTNHFHAVYATSTAQILAVGATGAIFSSSGTGAWMQETTPSNHDVWNVHALDSATGLEVVCAAGSGTTLRSNDGSSWTYASDVGDGNDLRALYVVAGGFVMAGDDGQVMTSMDAGATWQLVGATKVTSQPLRGITVSAGTYYIVGKSGTIVTGT